MCPSAVKPKLDRHTTTDRTGAYRKSDQRRDDLYACGLRKRASRRRCYLPNSGATGDSPPLPPIALHTALSYSRFSAASISASGIPCFTNAPTFSVHISNVIRSRAFACATQPQLFERPLSRFCAMTTLVLPHNVQRTFQ